MRNQIMMPMLLGGLVLFGVATAQAGDMMKDGMKHEHGMMDKGMHKVHKSEEMSGKHMDDDMMKDKGMDKKSDMSGNMMSDNDMDKDMHGMMHDH